MDPYRRLLRFLAISDHCRFAESLLLLFSGLRAIVRDRNRELMVIVLFEQVSFLLIEEI